MLGFSSRIALLVLAAPVAACLVSCSETSGRSSARDARARKGALDEVLLCEDSDERTPILFPHRVHYAPRDQGGHAIECGLCHHDYEGPDAGPPGSCRTCHFHHDVAVEKAIDSL